MMIPLDVNGYTLWADIEYTLRGQYYPATLEQPAEYPELDITSVTLCGVDVTAVLADDGFAEVIQQAVWEALEQ